MRTLTLNLTLAVLSVVCSGGDPAPGAKVLTVSTFLEETLITVPAPKYPLTIGGTPGALTLRNGQLMPAGTHTYRYACVDVENKLGPWSAPATVDLQLGGAPLIDCNAFVPKDPEVCAVYWEIDGKEARLYEYGVGPEQMGNAYPWAPIPPSPILDLRRGDNATLPAGTSTILTTQPPAPILTATGLPNEPAEWFYTFRTVRRLASGAISTEETARSPAIATPGIGGLPAGLVVNQRFYLPNVQIPVGAVSYRLWRNSRLVGEFPIDNMQPLALTVDNMQVYRATPGGAHSTISDLQAAHNAAKAGDTIVVDKDVTTLVPIIDRCRTADNAPDDSRAGITVTGPHGGRWKLLYIGAGEVAGDVALLMQNRATLYRGMELTGGSLAFSDFSGGQGFKCHWEECDFWDGVRILRTSAKDHEDHVGSECQWRYCNFGSLSQLSLNKGMKQRTAAIRIEGNQAADNKFFNSHVWSDWNRSRGTYPILIDTPCPVTFDGGVFGDFGYAFVGLGMWGSVRLGDVFIDGSQGGAGYPYGTIVQGIGYYPGQVRFKGGKLNAFLVNGRAPMLWQGSKDMKVMLDDEVVVQGAFRPAPLGPPQATPAAPSAPPRAAPSLAEIKKLRTVRPGGPYDLPPVFNLY